MPDITEHLKREPIDRGVIDGIEWAVIPAPLWGAANGYIKVPEGHPWRDEEFHDFGGIPWGECTFGEADGWQGFDTLHGGQYWPGSKPRMKDYQTYMTVNAVIDWTKQAARNCRAVANNGAYEI